MTIDLHALPGFFAEQIGEGVAGVVVGEDVNFEADAPLGVL